MPHQLETWMPLVAMALVGVSILLHRWKHTPNPMTWQEATANLGVFVVWRFVFFAGGVALQFWIFTRLAALIPWKLPGGPLMFIVAIVLADFCYYWKHRYEHEINLLWAQHAVHHSSEEFNLSTSLRLPWVGSYLNWPFFVPALALGFSAPQILLGHQVVLAYQYLVHTEFVGSLGFLEKILNTPSNHRVHHGRNEEYLDKNYGGILIVWDRVFKTYAPETTPVEYGTITRVTSRNPFFINWQPWGSLLAAGRGLAFGDKIRLWWMAPARTKDFLAAKSARQVADT